MSKTKRESCRNCALWLCAIIVATSIGCGTEVSDTASTIDRVRVESSAMNSVGYDSNESVLVVEFPNGTVYHYFDVPSEVHSGLLSAESHGKYFHRHIRGKFRHERVEE